MLRRKKYVLSYIVLLAYAFWPPILLLKQQFLHTEEKKIIIPFVFSLIYYVCFISLLTANPVNLLTQIDLVFFCRYSDIKRSMRGFGCVYRYLFGPVFFSIMGNGNGKKNYILNLSKKKDVIKIGSCQKILCIKQFLIK